MGENRTPRPEPSRREPATGISGLLRASPAGPRPAGCSARYPADLAALWRRSPESAAPHPAKWRLHGPAGGDRVGVRRYL